MNSFATGQPPFVHIPLTAICSRVVNAGNTNGFAAVEASGFGVTAPVPVCVHDGSAQHAQLTTDLDSDARLQTGHRKGATVTNTRATVPASQGRRIPYRSFAPVPMERHPRWYDVSTYARMLGVEIFVAAWSSGTRPPGIAYSRDWRDRVCLVLQIDGPARGQAKRALTELVEAGLLLVGDGRVHVLLTPEEVENQKPLESPSKARLKPLESPFDVSAQNDSTHVSQIREEKDLKEREPRAREAPPPVERSSPPPTRDDRLGFPDNTSPKSIGHDFLVGLGLWNPGIRADLVEFIGLRPEAERRRAHEVLERERRTDWFKENGSVRHIVDWWDRAYAKGRTPNQRDERPGLRNTAPVPNQNPLVSRLAAELEALMAKQRAVPSDSWEHTQLSNQIADLEFRVNRARYAA